MTHLIAGEPAPWFGAPTHGMDKFTFSAAAGRYILLVVLPSDPDARASVLRHVESHRELFSDAKLAAFLVTSDRALFDRSGEGRGLRWFFDEGDEIARLYGCKGEDGAAPGRSFLIDPSLRLINSYGVDRTEVLFSHLQNLGPPDMHGGQLVHAPVLIVPRVFEPALCRRLIQFYDDDGGSASGVMREIDGKTVGVLDDFKRRRDATIQDEGFRRELNMRLARRLIPEIEKAFNFKATRLERYIVARYGAEDGGYFRPHRDNTTAGTAHRRFAVSINLNAEEFEGGDLRFPEYGSRTYRPPTGGAVVFGCALLHEATAVTKGQRYAFLPFLYDEAAQKIREANEHLVQLAS